MASGSEDTAARVAASPTRCVVHIPAARPLPQMSPRVRITAPFGFLDGKKVTGQMANGENFAGNFEVAVPHQTRGTQMAVYLSSFEDFGMQLSVIALQCRKFASRSSRRARFEMRRCGGDIRTSTARRAANPPLNLD